MKTIKLSSIIISENRQRRSFEPKDLNELGESIKQRGLQNAIVLRKDFDTAFPVLVSGERRLRAIADLYAMGQGPIRYDNQEVPLDEIPYTDLGELDELAREEAEYDENSKRKNLTWQEEAAAVQRLAAARAKAAGVSVLQPVIVREMARTTTPAAAELPTGQLGVHQENTRRQIIVAQHLGDAEVKGAKSVDEAFKILRRKEEARKHVELAQTVGATFNTGVHTLLNKDCREWLVACEAEQFDVILTDPPYGMGADEFGDSGGMVQTGGHHYKDSYEMWQQLMNVFAEQSFRVAKKQAHLYVFCDFDRFHQLKNLLDLEGWDVHRTPLIWHKPTGMRLPWVDFGPQRKWEMILYAMKGRKPVTKIYPDLVSFPSDENLGHAAQKPVALLKDLLHRSVKPGDKILDPFAGTAGIIEAAHELKCSCTAIEMSEQNYGVALKRLEKLREGDKLPPELKGL